MQAARTDPVFPGADKLLRQIAATPAQPLTAAIVGPGGAGKSMLLKVVAAAYEKAGCPVVHIGRDVDIASVPDGCPVLIDDAQRLDSDALVTLRAAARAADARMVVAYRQWPRPEGLSALGAQLSRHHSPIVLGHLGLAEVAAHVGRRVGCVPPDALVALVHDQSGGSPMFVGLVTQAMLDTGRFDPRHPDRFRRPTRVSVAPGLAERLRYLLEALDPDIYRLLEAMALGAALDTDVLGALLDRDPADLTDTVAAACATGLLTETGELIVFVRNLVLRLMPVLRVRVLQRRLAEIQLDSGGPTLAAGRRLAEADATGRRAAAVLEAAATEALRTSPHLAGELFDAAVRAGRPPRAVAAPRAQAAALDGDPALALRLANEILTAEDAGEAERRQAVSVTAAVLAQRGFAARTAELYRARGGVDALPAVPALLAVGELDKARAVLAAAPGVCDPPTLAATAARLVATGMLATIDGDTALALSQLSQAAGLLEPAGAAALLPYSPAALLAVVACQCGEGALADTILTAAVAAKVCGGLAHNRHLLLRGWTAMTRGALDSARGVLDRVTTPLEPADELLAAALAAGVARRSGDQAGLASAFARARTALIRHPVDLYLVQAVGELAVAAAVLGERASIAAFVEQARVVLARLGDPPLWTLWWRWSELHADLAGGDLDAARRGLTALTAVDGGYSARIADAATCWLRVARGEVEPADVRAAATGLHDVGLNWDAAHLAATAALRVDDRKSVAALMACARSLNDGAVPEPLPAVGEVDDVDDEAAVDEPVGHPAPVLSERELEVGRLVLAGLTHKQIGARLFISAKTVEHHVARMRTRLGADGRNELFGRLRVLVGEDGFG